MREIIRTLIEEGIEREDVVAIVEFLLEGRNDDINRRLIKQACRDGKSSGEQSLVGHGYRENTAAGKAVGKNKNYVNKVIDRTFKEAEVDSEENFEKAPYRELVKRATNKLKAKKSK